MDGPIVCRNSREVEMVLDDPTNGNSGSKDGKKPKYRFAQTQFDLILTLSDFVSHQKRTLFPLFKNKY